MSATVRDPQPSLRARRKRLADPAFRWFVTLAGTSVFVILAAMVVRTTTDAWPIFQHEGFFGFLTGDRWVSGSTRGTGDFTGTYGAWPFIYGTLVTALIAIVIALPLALCVAIYINQLAPKRLRNPLSYTVEMLAAVPSIVFGMWGLFWLVPNVLLPVFGWLESVLGWFFLFEGPVFGRGYLAAGIVLAIMILPIITAIVREVIAVHPADQQHAAYALGATRFEVIRKVVLPSSFSGIVGATMLGLGRAIGETIAVMMLIGSTKSWEGSLLRMGDSMAAHIAATFKDSSPEAVKGLMAIGVALFLFTMIINVAARLLVWRIGRVAGDAAV
ncbi:phosphate ABC transporter permease subunit PstC [Streptomyces alkaliphilus]|uniref:Phosphate transport system permease protein n=1 Tax=Streptomyces alkaliphilus TaxID=1472722 RepID=A0A7W3TCS5_9ACTN|nr:phosphate ABC transporter permease subunit PstC [Streptomyces alkaliphilus]MBB0244125.1 phosphate ABC transporter permease subunit PstC [Streptomyces alkaliphilus]